MTLKECYQILGLSQSASLEEVKRVYRRRAFELHPDLNPGVADASQQFQKLNEAYVILSKLIFVREEREGRKTATGTRESAQTKHSEQKAETPSSATAEDTASKKTAQSSQHNQSTNATHSTSSGQKTDSDNSSGHAASDKGTTSGASATSTASGASETSGSHTAGHRDEAHKRQTPRDNVYTEHQEVLHDILSDPFARRVFEDIYSEIRKNVPSPSPAPSPSVKKKSAPSPLSNLLNWGQRRINLEFSNGIGGALKSWLRNQIDEEQLFELPAKRLIPGARIRLQIRHGFSDEVTTLDITLPPDFKPEKPVRLKGMGKKLGHWQGDLYLRFSAKA